MKTTMTTDRFVCDNWDEPEVKVTGRGKGHSQARKVVSRGTIHIDVPGLLGKVTDALRSGFDVELRDGDEAFVRFIACVGRDGVMYPSAQSMGRFRRESLADKRPRYVRAGVEIAADEALATPKRDGARRQSKVSKFVRCPKCGCDVRVGREYEQQVE